MGYAVPVFPGAMPPPLSYRACALIRGARVAREHASSAKPRIRGGSRAVPEETANGLAGGRGSRAVIERMYSQICSFAARRGPIHSGDSAPLPPHGHDTVSDQRGIVAVETGDRHHQLQVRIVCRQQI